MDTRLLKILEEETAKEPNAVEYLQKSNLLLADLAKSTYNYF